MTRFGLMLVAVTVALLAGCNGGNAILPDDGFQTFTFSFEDGFEGWTADATDTFVGPDEIDWSVTTSTARATSGNTSLLFSVDNMTDAAKVWIERAFVLEPDTNYDVQIEFDFASRDYGDFNLWTTIAGALSSNPEVANDLTDAYDGDTKTADDDLGYRWLSISRTVTVRTDASGEIHVVAGVWGTWETLREYYIDNLRVSFTPRSS